MEKWLRLVEAVSIPNRIYQEENMDFNLIMIFQSNKQSLSMLAMFAFYQITKKYRKGRTHRIK